MPVALTARHREPNGAKHVCLGTCIFGRRNSEPSTMVGSSHRAMRLRHLCVALLLSAGTATTATTMAQAGKLDSRSAVAMLFHGNYCGMGSRPGTRPVDALDAACMRHDACAPSGGIPSCDCNARLQIESTAISQNVTQPPDIQFLASVTAAGAGLMLCAPVSPGPAIRSTGSRIRHISDRHRAEQ